MPGARRRFEQQIEATLATHDDLPASVRADVLQQLANQLRLRTDDAEHDRD